MQRTIPVATGLRQGVRALAAILFLLLGSAGQAFAHAQLVGSDPPDGAVLAQAPAAVTLTFSEPVRPLVSRLTGPAGGIEVLPGTTSPEEAVTRLVVALPPGLQPGTHTLSWRVTSADGHPIGGGLVFSVGRPGGTGPQALPPAETAIAIGLWAARFLVLVGLVIGVGGAGWAALFAQAKIGNGRDPLLTAILLAALAATPLWIAFQGLDALGESLAGVTSPGTWTAGLTATAYGRAALLAAAALLSALVSLGAAAPRARLGLAALGLALGGLAATAAGHAATAPPRFATVPAIALHMLGSMAWIGGLLPLYRALKGPSGKRALTLFSRAIPPIFAVLVASGLLLAVVQVRMPANLWTTAYGRVLLAKLAVVALLVALAAANRFLLTRRASSGEGVARRRLQRSILAEIVLGTLVLAILGLWRFTPPPRALASPPAQERLVEQEGVSAVLSLAPPATGPVRITITTLRLDGQPLAPLGLTVELAKPTDAIGPFVREAGRGDDGRFTAEGFVLPVAGTWVVRVTVLVDDFRSIALTGTFEVAGP